jgi:hypothetical protein
MSECLRILNAKAEVVLERIKITVSVKESMLAFEAEGRDQAIDRLSHCIASRPESSIVLGRSNGQIFSPGVEHLKSGQVPANLREAGVASDSLQDFTQDKVRQPKTLPGQLSFEPLSMWIHSSSEVVDPDSRVDYHHLRSPYRITMPALSSQCGPDEIRQGRLPSAPCREACEPHLANAF